MRIPCLLDADFQIRFLISMPLLIAAELVAHRRVSPMVDNFLKRGLIPDNEMDKFNAAIESAYRLRNSVLAESFLMVLVYAVGIFVFWQNYISLDAGTWYMPLTVSGPKVSLAGLWFIYVSLPVFQFLCRKHF